MKKNNLLLILMLLTFITSCRKGYLDINSNPDAAANVDPELTLNFSAIQYANQRMAEIYGTRLYSQIWLGGAYNEWADEIYEISPFTVNNFWSMTYRSCINNANSTIEQSKVKYSNPDNAIAQVNVWKAFIFYNTTMLWEDVPFSEVGQINTFVAPKFDDQKDVLNGVLSLLNDAISKFNVLNTERIKDPWFSGDIAKWQKTAKALKLKVLMTMVDKEPSKATEIGSLIASGGFMSSNTDNWKFNFLNDAGKKNPLWRIVELYYGQQDAWLASNVTLNMLQSKNDPRLPRFFDIGPVALDYDGIDPYEDFADVEEISRVSSYILNAVYPDYMMTFAEQELLIAEAILRGFASGNAQSKFESGVTASMDHYGADVADGATYVSNLATLADLSLTDGLNEIYHEQYLNLFDRVVDPWTQWRRVEYPVLSVPVDATTSDIIRRMIYSPTEQAANPNSKPNKPLDEKMWFDL